MRTITDNVVFVDPALLSPPSPASDASGSHPSPSPSESQLSSSSRKRPRLDMTPEERKEARAHRNRIAAQNSRDKRKAQFAGLEYRLAELEEENRQLRAGMTQPALKHVDERRKEDGERDKARERENAELKERIKSLERGWETVMKVLAAQGISMPSSSSAPDSPQSSSATSNSPVTFPVFVPSAPVFPITPSPSISASSIVPEADESDTGGVHRGNPPRGAPAAGELDTAQQSAFTTPTSSPASAPTPTAFPPTPEFGTQTTDDIAMETWIETFFSDTSSLSASTPTSGDVEEPDVSFITSAATSTSVIDGLGFRTGWKDDAEMQKILELLPKVESEGDQIVDVRAGLGLDLSGWSFGQDAAPTSSRVGVF